MKNILFVLGTRPEAIKMAPIIMAMKEEARLCRPLVCNTEQQKEMSGQALSFFELQTDFNLDVMTTNQTLAGLQTRLMSALDAIYTANDIAGTVVQGDTMSAFCGALCSFYHQRPVFHVEAGLRSMDLSEPFPEEAFRCLIARLAALHFAPTENNRAQLLAEGIRPETVLVTGNTVVDALYRLPISLLDEAASFFQNKGVTQPTVLVTVHRRENHGPRLQRILAAVKTLAAAHPELDWIIPVHPNPNVSGEITRHLESLANVFLFQPLPYPQLIYLIINSRLVLTDSGGIQEEAGALGRPILVLRYKTERVESLEAGLSELVGADPEKIISRSEALLSHQLSFKPAQTKNEIYGNGRSSHMILSLIESFFGQISPGRRCPV